MFDLVMLPGRGSGIQSARVESTHTVPGGTTPPRNFSKMVLYLLII